jgi:hypothetical protein
MRHAQSSQRNQVGHPDLGFLDVNLPVTALLVDCINQASILCPLSPIIVPLSVGRGKPCEVARGHATAAGALWGQSASTTRDLLLKNSVYFSYNSERAKMVRRYRQRGRLKRSGINAAPT